MDNKRLTIAIAGMGLIGGTLGLAIKTCTRHTVIGSDLDEGVFRTALDCGAADKTGAEHLPEADLLILALAPGIAAGFLRQYAERLRTGAVVTDVCGVKRAVTLECEPVCRRHGLHFVGGHPMAGRECSGIENAVADLFEGAYYIFTPAEDTPDGFMKILKWLAMDIGCADVTITTPEKHDRMIAFTSQLPHVLAGAYVKSPRCPGHKGFSAGSYRDVSRVATVDEKLWTELFFLNRDNLCDEIDTLIENLRECRDAIYSGDAAILQRVLREGRLRKERAE